MGDPTVVNGVLRRTSPSSIEQMDRCATQWWLNYVGGFDERSHPTTVFGQRVGQKAHTALEDFMLKGIEPTDVFARALKKYVPPVGPGLLVETATTGLTAAGVPVKGRIDWTHGYLPTRPIVADWKTRKDLGKYKKTEAELRADIQMNAYARWAVEHYSKAESIDVAHYYVETKNHVKKLSDGSLVVFDPGYDPETDRLLLNFSIDDTKTFWSNVVEPIVERMKAVAAVPVGQQHTIEPPEDMVSRDSPCQMFGGCGRKYVCPHSPMNKMRARLGSASSTQEQPPMSLASLLAAHSAPAAAPTPPAVPPSDGIVTADAGSRTNPPAPVKLEQPVAAPAPKQDVAQVTTSEAKLAETVAATHVDARTPEAKALDEKAAAEKHDHKYDLTVDGKPACACGRKKPGRIAAPKVEAAPTPPSEPKPTTVPAQVVMFDKAKVDLPIDAPTRVHDDPVQAKVNREVLVEMEKAEAQAERMKQVDSTPPSKPILLINCHTNSPDAVDLTQYAAGMANEVAKAVNAVDPRFVDKSSPLAYGAWKGALTEHVRNNLPVGRRLVIWTRGDEVAEVVAAALAGVQGMEVHRG